MTIGVAAMPAFTPLRKAMVVIAVSNYDPPYEALPGTLTSARRIAKWARGPGDGRNYKVIEITDETMAGQPSRPVTVDRLRTEITALLDGNIVDRLVVYFAGHGAVRSMAEEFWLLTHAGTDDGECVGVMQFVNGLKNYGIGAHNSELLRGQLVIFADACRNVHHDALSFVPNPVMTRKGTAPSLHVDLFRSTTLGAYAFQVKAVAGAEPYCLFSSVLCDALEGNVPEVIERENHAFKPVISNHTLADYLDQEVPRRAMAFKEAMEPDNQATIRPNHNYYDILRLPWVAQQQQHQQQGGTIPLPPNVADAVLHQLGISGLDSGAAADRLSQMDDGVVRRAFESALQTAFPDVMGPTPPIELPSGQLLPGRNSTDPIQPSVNVDWGKALSALVESRRFRLEGADLPPPDLVAARETGFVGAQRDGARIPRMRFEPEREAATGFRRSIGRAALLSQQFAKTARKYSPQRVLFDGRGPVALPKGGVRSLSQVAFGWAYVPMEWQDQAVFVRQENGWTLAPVLRHSETVLLEELPGEVLLRSTSSGLDWDVSLSSGVQSKFTDKRASRARELGDTIRFGKDDAPNNGIRAGYLYKFAGDDDNVARTAHYMADYGLPFDLAAIAATSMKWMKRRNRWYVFADLPEVAEEPDTSRPNYAGTAFSIRKNVPVWGLFPIHRQGWLLLGETDRYDVPPILRMAAGSLVGARAVVFRSDVLETLMDRFDYVTASL